MFSPVGSQPPSVYWRRRLIVLGSIVLLLVLAVLTIKAAMGGDGGSPQADGSTPAASPTSTTPLPTKSPSTSDDAEASTRSSAKRTQASSSAPSSARVERCTKADLTVRAMVGDRSYKVGQEPVLELLVTNTGKAPCVQDLADRQVEFKVYNGESRVWGSHDCEVQDGTTDRTLAVDRPVQLSMQWTGYTSQKGCNVTRQRVGAGTYTLYATLSGKTGKAAQFTIG